MSSDAPFGNPSPAADAGAGADASADADAAASRRGGRVVGLVAVALLALIAAEVLAGIAIVMKDPAARWGELIGILSAGALPLAAVASLRHSPRHPMWHAVYCALVGSAAATLIAALLSLALVDGPLASVGAAVELAGLAIITCVVALLPACVYVAATERPDPALVVCFACGGVLMPLPAVGAPILAVALWWRAFFAGRVPDRAFGG